LSRTPKIKPTHGLGNAYTSPDMAQTSNRMDIGFRVTEDERDWIYVKIKLVPTYNFLA
jgi:hypothetical protein